MLIEPTLPTQPSIDSRQTDLPIAVSSQPLRLVMVAFVVPYPPHHGGRMDIWRRLKALHHAGVAVQLISWISEPLADSDRAEMEKYAEDVVLLPIENTLDSLLFRLVRSPFAPREINARTVRGPQRQALLQRVRQFRPQAILLDGTHGGPVGLDLSQTLDLPLVVRSHNIEHLYYRRLFKSAQGSERIKRFLSTVGLERYEKIVLRCSDAFYDISVEDLNFWAQQGFTHGRYLAPFVELPPIEPTDAPLPQYDVAFLGNLCIPNNVNGVVWFVTEVLPIVRQRLPQTTVLIAGSNPVARVRSLCESQEGVFLRANPASSIETYRSGKVLINPMQTGSGVSIKSLEMLATDRPVVSTPQGVAGIPAAVQQRFAIATDAPSFAAAVIQALSAPAEVSSSQASSNRSILNDYFGYGVVAEMLADIHSLIEQRRSIRP